MAMKLKNIPRKLFLKYFWRLDFISKRNSKIPLMVLGSQRSGTTMLTKLLERCPECTVYRGHEAVAFFNSRIISFEILDRLIRMSPTRIVVFKSLNDIQHADRFLSLHPNAKAVWIYRQYRDVASSAVDRWGTAHLEIMKGIAERLILHPGQAAIREKMSPETLDAVKRISASDLTPVEGAALLWYSRNMQYFDLKLEDRREVLLVKYEDFVLEPERHIQRLLDFIPCQFDGKYADDIDATRIDKSPRPVFRPALEALCSDMLDKLDECYKMQMGHQGLRSR